MAENVFMNGYTRVSKADGRQVHDLQRDALIAAGVDPACALARLVVAGRAGIWPDCNGLFRP